MKKVIIYTDGSCKGNPGPGGWAALLIYNDHKKEIYGGEKHTTNQRMELKAAIEGLKALKEPCEVELFSDSAYLINAFKQGWLEKWQHNGWKTAAREPVENQDLWRELLKLCRYHKARWIKVKGHSDNEFNNRCDHLAQKAAAELF
ncbi:MAG TPA: ribonuclease HI [Firmicutes bacterium]|jgi:ribonuclease HI|nr:ribonuclease HI [Bacillota bacterium]